MDARAQVYNRFQTGMADIRISRHPLRKEIILALQDVEHDIYMDVALSSECARVFKQAIVQKNPNMTYVQEQFDVLVEPEDILPFHVLFTKTGVPRPLLLDDRIIIDGAVYVVSKLKPTNRELNAIYECLVYPERDSRKLNDPLALYYIRFRRGLTEVGFEGIYGAPVVMEVVYGGCPTQMSFDGTTWQRFYQRSVVNVPDEATQLYIMDATQRCVSLTFGETFSVQQVLPTSGPAAGPVLEVTPASLTFTDTTVRQRIEFTAAPAPHLVFGADVQVRKMGDIYRVFPTDANNYFIEFVYCAEAEESGQISGYYEVGVVGYDNTTGSGLTLPLKIQAGDKTKPVTVTIPAGGEAPAAPGAQMRTPRQRRKKENVIYR